MNVELIAKFWKEFQIPTQEQTNEFPYANPSDAARSLIRAHNWAGTITESLIEKSQQLKGTKNTLALLEMKVERLERFTLALNPPPTWATKNKELQKAYIWSKAQETDLKLFQELENSREILRNEILGIEKEMDLFSQMLKTLERTTDWVVHYINWVKHENNLE